MGLEKYFQKTLKFSPSVPLQEERGQQKIEKIFCENPKVLLKLDVNRIKRTTEAMSRTYNLAGVPGISHPLFS